jgi:hypothetical protein
MTPEVLRQAAITLFGERGWMSRLAESLGVDRSSVSRWFAGLPVPGPVAAAVEAWLLLYKLTGLRPEELGRLDQIKPSSEGGEPPIHRFRK